MSCSVKACVFPVSRDGLCAIHLRDRVLPLPLPEAAPSVVDRKPKELVNRGQVEQKQMAEKMLKEGKSISEVSRETGLARLTVLRVRDMIRDELPKECTCGRPLGHRGWCTRRVENSPARQKVVKDLIERRRTTKLPADHPKQSISGLREILEKRKTELERELDTVFKEIASLDAIVAIADKYRK